MELTEAEIRALVAVDGGKVTRVYKTNGNVLRGPPGISSATLWRLDKKRLIVDKEGSHGGTTYHQVLTAAGRAALAGDTTRRRVRIHQPFALPIHWAKPRTKKARRGDPICDLTDKESEAERYTIKDAMKIVDDLRGHFPSAVIVIM